MMRTLLPALLLALLVAPAALPQGPKPLPVDERVKLLEADVALLQAKLHKQQELLERALARQTVLRSEARRLVQAVDRAERSGFTYPAPHTDAKQALLDGLRRFGRALSGAKAAGK